MMNTDWIPRPTLMKLGTKSLSLAMLNKLTNKQVNDILKEYQIDRDKYPIEWTAKRILNDIISSGGWVK